MQKGKLPASAKPCRRHTACCAFTHSFTFLRKSDKCAVAQALDVALKHNTSMKPKCQAFARAFFWADPDKIRPLGGGAEVRCRAGFAHFP